MTPADTPIIKNVNITNEKYMLFVVQNILSTIFSWFLFKFISNIIITNIIFTELY